MVIHQALRSPMRYQIIAEPRYVRADLFNRHTAEETGEFLSAVASECIRLQCYHVLHGVNVRTFRDEPAAVAWLENGAR